MGSNCCKKGEIRPSMSLQLERSNSPKDLANGKPDVTTEKIMDHSPMLRTIIWRRGNLIGEGVYGKVFQAMDQDTGELLAVKIIKLSNNSETAEKQFYLLSQEIELLKSLRHINIIKYYQTDISMDSKCVNIILEYVTGGSLRDLLLKYGSFSENVIKNYIIQILKGLVYLHSKNIVHRDLKSANILVTEDAVIKLSDFGCSRKMENGDISMSIKGSPYWMAPEVVLQEGHGLPSDIWSLGCLIIEMATGKPPWSEISNKASDIIKLISMPGRVPKIPDLSSDLKDIVKKCLNRDPSLRPTARLLLMHQCITSYSMSTSHSYVSKNSINGWA
ncbi:hypothetical protein SteCoe_18535 [Stentor coeruleus]|uniref:Protein kinase domain-containing protein n=1 Tax=Stentor coeruleus TaxID=5963 RepID=A0A1R2BWG7_9CILI|nr:hypothetical protein SteCoe_18535 [Stentor coeruleus]